MDSSQLILVLSNLLVLVSPQFFPRQPNDCSANGVFPCPIEPNAVTPAPPTPPGLIPTSRPNGPAFACDYYTCIWYPALNKWIRRTYNCPRPSASLVRFNTTTGRCTELPACPLVQGCVTEALCTAPMGVAIPVPSPGMPDRGCATGDAVECYFPTTDCNPPAGVQPCMCTVPPTCVIGNQRGCTTAPNCPAAGGGGGTCTALLAEPCWHTARMPMPATDCVRPAMPAMECMCLQA